MAVMGNIKQMEEGVKKLKKNQGFTLIELVVVMAIIAVLAVLVIGAITVARNTAAETTNRSNARTFQAGLEKYFSNNKSYPAYVVTGGLASFDTLYNDNLRDLGITHADYPSGCDTTGQAHGGGQYSYNSSTGQYTLTVWNYDCTKVLSGSSNQFTN